MIQPKKSKVKAVVVKKTTSVKVTPKRDRSKDNPADEYKGMKDAKGNPAVDVGGEGRTPPFKKGGIIKKAKNGKSFPDLNKDGKVTKADVLKGRGVIAKKGATIKKAQNGYKSNPYATMDKARVEAAGYKKTTDGKFTKAAKPKATMKSGGSVKKCKYGCK